MVGALFSVDVYVMKQNKRDRGHALTIWLRILELQRVREWGAVTYYKSIPMLNFSTFALLPAPSLAPDARGISEMRAPTGTAARRGVSVTTGVLEK